jgi:hypothetical protein
VQPISAKYGLGYQGAIAAITAALQHDRPLVPVVAIWLLNNLPTNVPLACPDRQNAYPTRLALSYSGTRSPGD